MTRDDDAAVGLSGDEAAILAEFGYDARCVARVARRRDGARRLAGMVLLARAGRLPFRETGSPSRRAIARARGSEPSVPLLVSLVLLLPVSLVVALSVGTVVLLSRAEGGRGASYGTLMPWWAAALLIVVPLAVLDVMARWRGPRARWGDGDGDRGARGPWSPLGMRRVPAGVQELACLPLLTLVPLYVVQRGARVPAVVPLEVVSVLLLGVCALTMVVAGGLLPVLVLVAAWAGWSWIALRGPSGWATLGLLGVTVAVGLPYGARLARRVNLV